MTIKLNHSSLVIIDLQEKLLPFIADNQTVINNCSWLNQLAQRLNIPTIVCEQYPKGLGLTCSTIRDRVPISVIVDKVSFSAARDLVFTDKLAALNKNQVIICGIESHVCVLQTALDLKNLDYDVYVVADAIGSRQLEDKKYAIKRLIHNGITVVTKEMVLFEWLETAGTSLFKSISNEFLK
jgi:nicotinamidase-related amidase